MIRWPSPWARIHWAALALLAACTASAQPPSLDTRPYRAGLGPNVLVFDPSMDTAAMQATLDALHAQQAQRQFGTERYALLFKPGVYDLRVTVDYYVQASGLGRVPGDVEIRGAVQSTATTHSNNVTKMFWRSAENFRVRPVPEGSVNTWAVSQAAPFRRMHVLGDVVFDQGGWASGGYLANAVVEGKAGTHTGQQWFTRNAELGSWYGANWNATFVGVEGAPAEQRPEPPYTVVERTPVFREKPFLTVDAQGELAVFVPALSHDTVGVTWREGTEPGSLMPLSDFHVAHPGQDTADSLNAALQAGRSVLFTPGIYPLDDTVRVTRPDTVVLGLGLPTLVPQTGKVALSTADVDGIKIAGLLFDAGPQPSPALVQIGDPGSSADHAANPTSLHDIYCRVGGATAGTVDVAMVLHSHHVLGDHFWLWRADHGAGASWHMNRSRTGLVVHGDDVTLYGLFNEHFQEHQTLWKGERGRTYFYQSEVPYDPPDQASWSYRGQPGFASYKVEDHVQTHQAWGLGIYSFFHPREAPDRAVRLRSAIECPKREGVVLNHISLFAGRHGGIDHAVNGEGPGAATGGSHVTFDGVP